MQATVEDINSVQRKVKIDLSPEHVDKAFDRAYKNLQKKAQVRGFRPGKAPIQMIKKMYGQSVAADVADQLIREHLFSAIEQNEIRPVATPEIEKIEIPKQGEAFTFTAIVDVMPKIEVAGYKELTATCLKREVTAKDIDTEIERIRRQSAKHKTNENQEPVKKGQIAHFDLIGGGADRTGLVVEVGAGDTFKEVDEALIDMTIGSDKEVTWTQGDKTHTGRLKLTEVKELMIPAFDDEFAKDIGYQTAAELENLVRQNLERRAKDLRQSELENSVMDALLAKNTFEVPPAMVAAVIDDMIEQMRLSDQDKKSAKVDNDYRKTLIEPAKKRARSTLLLWEIARAESIDITEGDIEQHFRKMLGLGETDTAEEKSLELLERLKKNVQPGFKDNLKLEKTIKQLIDWSKIEERVSAN